VQRLDVRMVLALAQYPSDGTALFSDPQALVGAQLFDVDLAMHAGELVYHAKEVKARHPTRITGTTGRFHHLPLVFRRFVPRPIDLASVRRCSA
jgi:hypothetical protein